DLILTNGHVDDFTHSGLAYRMRPQYFRNLGGGRFRELRAQELGPFFAGEYLGRGLARLDWNRDGREEAVISHIDAPAALPSAGKADSAAAPPPARRRVQPGPPPKAPPPKIKPELLHGEMRDLDRRSAERLKRGQLPIEAQLDLHGLNQLDAQRALEAFLAAAQEAGRRCVLVITGKGGVGRAPAGGEAGVLRRAVPLWLNQAGLREKVLAYAYAQPKHGGQGALYVLVKRQRSGC
ncbi:MAG: Smr/MutS family protein, partial [Rhodovibrionaceae bacterium]